MKRIEIVVNGEAFPCSPTMGAMLRFEKETGRDISKIRPDSLSDLCTYLYCCVASASQKEHKEFNMSLQEFADNISPDDMKEWNDAISTDSDDSDSDVEKKNE